MGPEDIGELHIASLLVQRDPGQAGMVRDGLAGVPGAELQIEEGAKAIVTVEGASAGDIAEALTRIQLLPGVMSAVMVFHHQEAGEPDGGAERGVP
ncbi:chaperone NapD [Rhodospirillum centenum]|uniref:Chaperone NapD n=1 Tax=Rhodospirillum centenum (strain ATCC 51521 / SW) TaxID=414684 RepID=B6IR09_RHOCS|nr:chaperone NapD [Rhodospirillum centenum]ACI97895.1 NapD protein [Rhodospirillum centenum SW]